MSVQDRTPGVWWRGKRDGRQWDIWRWIPGWTLQDLHAARLHVMRSAPDPLPLGFVPRTFASEAAREKFDLPDGLEGILLSFALYQRIQAAAGSYEGGPPERVWVFPNVFYEDQTKMRSRKIR